MSKTVELFHRQPNLTRADRKRLAPHLSGNNKLADLLAADLLSEDDLMRLVLMEVEGKKRLEILARLLGRLKSLQWLRITKQVFNGTRERP